MTDNVWSVKLHPLRNRLSYTLSFHTVFFLLSFYFKSFIMTYYQQQKDNNNIRPPQSVVNCGP